MPLLGHDRDVVRAGDREVNERNVGAVPDTAHSGHRPHRPNSRTERPSPADEEKVRPHVGMVPELDKLLLYGKHMQLHPVLSHPQCVEQRNQLPQRSRRRLGGASRTSKVLKKEFGAN